MTWQICTWTLSSQQMVLHDYQESHYINFPASFRVQTKHYETKMSNPMYSLKNPTKFSFLLSTCLSDDTANRKCLFLWVHVPQYDILQKWSSFFFPRNISLAWPTKQHWIEKMWKKLQYLFSDCAAHLLILKAMKAVHTNKSFYMGWNSYKFQMAQNTIKSAWFCLWDFIN